MLRRGCCGLAGWEVGGDFSLLLELSRLVGADGLDRSSLALSAKGFGGTGSSPSCIPNEGLPVQERAKAAERNQIRESIEKEKDHLLKNNSPVVDHVRS